RELANARDSAILLPLDEDTLVIEAADGPSAGDLVGDRIETARAPAGEVMRTGEPLVFDDPESPGKVPYLALPRDYRGRAILVPMRGSDSDDAPIGVLAAVQRIDEPLAHPRDVEMLAAFAGQAAVALQL